MTVAPIITTTAACDESAGRARQRPKEQGAVAGDHVTTIPAVALGSPIGRLLDEQEAQLTHAIHAAFDLD